MDGKYLNAGEFDTLVIMSDTEPLLYFKPHADKLVKLGFASDSASGWTRTEAGKAFADEHKFVKREFYRVS